MAGEQSILSEEYGDFIIDFRNRPSVLEGFENGFVHVMNDSYAVVHIPLVSIPENIMIPFNYSAIPNVFGLLSEASVEASGVSKLRNLPNFNLTGSGVLIGIVDTGIDYRNPVFLKADGTTKIASIWDQTIQTGNWPNETLYGTEYNTEQINLALQSSNPLEIVPSMDVNGHGTMMAGIVVGTENQSAGFQGVAPDSELVIVKLKEAKQFLRNFHFIPEGVDCFQENDIMWGVHYCLTVARKQRKPIVIVIGLGTSQTSHAGRSQLGNYLTEVADITNVGVVIAVGNEGNSGRHYYSSIPPNSQSNSIELVVGEGEGSFSMELWGQYPGLYSIDIQSPNGEYIPRIAGSFQLHRVFSFIFEETTLYVDYQLTESLTGDQLILLRFRNASAGIWRFTVYSQSDLALGFHLWLPMGNFISDNTRFVQPNIYTTVLTPSSSLIPIAVTAYNPVNESLYLNASRGYTTDDVVKPEIAAPGVNYIGPDLNGGFVPFSGTSVAAAHTAGVVALFLEWAAVRGNEMGVDTIVIKNYFIRGARRRSNLVYPNRDWGYGILDIFNVFDILRRNI